MKRIVLVVVALLLTGYIGIVFYAMYYVFHINEMESFRMAVLFEIIGFLYLSFAFFESIVARKMKMPYKVAVISVALIYTIFLNGWNMIGIKCVSNSVLALCHFIMLLLFVAVTIPMCIMGNKMYQ